MTETLSAIVPFCSRWAMGDKRLAGFLTGNRLTIDDCSLALAIKRRGPSGVVCHFRSACPSVGSMPSSSRED